MWLLSDVWLAQGPLSHRYGLVSTVETHGLCHTGVSRVCTVRGARDPGAPAHVRRHFPCTMRPARAGDPPRTGSTANPMFGPAVRSISRVPSRFTSGGLAPRVRLPSFLHSKSSTHPLWTPAYEEVGHWSHGLPHAIFRRRGLPNSSLIRQGMYKELDAVQSSGGSNPGALTLPARQHNHTGPGPTHPKARPSATNR